MYHAICEILRQRGKPATGFEIEDHGEGPFIAVWDVSLGAQPTSQDIADAEEAAAKRALRVGITAEAERRIAVGRVIDGIQFRTDDATMIRLKGLIDEFDANLVPEGGVTYRTASGAAVTYTDRAAVAALYAAANLYRSKVLEASNLLQDSPPEDFDKDMHWPDWKSNAVASDPTRAGT